jgi:hypothetical protein
MRNRGETNESEMLFSGSSYAQFAKAAEAHNAKFPENTVFLKKPAG